MLAIELCRRVPITEALNQRQSLPLKMIATVIKMMKVAQMMMKMHRKYQILSRTTRRTSIHLVILAFL